MIIEDVKCKLVSFNKYLKKDKDTKQETGEVGYMISLATDFRDKNCLKNRILNPICSKDFVLNINEERLRFGVDVRCKLDIPLVDPGDKSVFPTMLYDMKLVGGNDDVGIPFN